MIVTARPNVVIPTPSKADLDAFQKEANALVDSYFHIGHSGPFLRRQAAMLVRHVKEMAEKKFGIGAIPLFEIVEITRRAAIAYRPDVPPDSEAHAPINKVFDILGPKDFKS